jgi:aspartyl-tRNA(Asn)/glutamyl-tRNA(Gln) amidotransferase subunit A
VTGPVGVLTDLFDDAETAVADVCRRGVEHLERAGVETEPVTIGWRAPGLGLLLAVEFAAAWGDRAAIEPERFPPDILDALDRAGRVSPARVQAARDELGQARIELTSKLGRFSALLCPTVPTSVPTVEAENVATSTRFTRVFSALGWPAMSVPCGFDGDGRPVGLHLASPRDLTSLMAVGMALDTLPRP